jgi:cell division septum initiation protein DivIVA
VDQAEHEQKLSARVEETVGRLASLTEGLMVEVRAIASEVRSTVDAMRGVTSDAITRMNAGAETLLLAADGFTKAGQGVSGALQQATGISTKLVEAAGLVSASSATLESVVADYGTTRAAFAAMVSDLRGTIENAKREANITSDILSRIEASAQKLGQAQIDAEAYLEGISKVIVGTHSEFAAGLTKLLGEANKQFHERLSAATGLLREAILELESALAPAMRET